MTLDDKVNMLHGELNNFYGFYNGPIDSLGIPALTMADGPGGVRIAHPDVNQQKATQLPAPIALAATWDSALADEYGKVIGTEAHSTGHNVSLGPVLDIARVPEWGRIAEGFGEDPLLAGVMGTRFVQGIQSSPVISTVKHFLAYSQESGRLTGSNMVLGERTMQEIYARPFGDVVRDAQPGAVMCSFNQVNDVYTCENDMILNQILKTQQDFQGWVMTDYGASFHTVRGIMSGLDQEMPGNLTPEVGPGECSFCGPLIDAVNSGEVPESRVDDAVLRILREMFQHGLFDKPPVVQPLPVQQNGATARDIAEKGMVLLKNDNNTLPLKGATSIAVIGSDADTLVHMGGSGAVLPTYEVTPLQAIRARAGSGTTVKWLPGSDPVTAAAYLPGPTPVPSDFLTPPNGEGNGLRAEYFLNPDFSGTPDIDRIDPYAAINGGFFLFPGFEAGSPHFPMQPVALNTKSSIRWTGQFTAPVAGSYQLTLTSNGTSRLFVDNDLVASTQPVENLTDMNTNTATLSFAAGSVHSIRIDFVNDGPNATDFGPRFKFGWTPPADVVAPQAKAAADLARDSQAAIVLVRDYGGEGGDKSTLELPNGQAQVIQQVAAANPRTIVVLEDTGVVKTSDWDSSAPAILQAWYGGQEQGNAIAAILWGDVNPSGRLPITIPTDETHTPVSTSEQFPGDEVQSGSAGSGDGGSDSGSSDSEEPGTILRANFSEGIYVGYRGYEKNGIKPAYPFGHGLSYTTFQYSNLRTSQEGNLLISLTVQNTGSVAGTETVQVYAGKLPVDGVDTSSKSLAGWTQVTLQPGQSKDVAIRLNPKSLSYWDVNSHTWVMPTGSVPILVGASSADIRLTGSLQVTSNTQLTLNSDAKASRTRTIAK